MNSRIFYTAAASNLLTMFLVGAKLGHKYRLQSHRKHCYTMGQIYQGTFSLAYNLAANAKRLRAPIFAFLLVGNVCFPTALYYRAFTGMSCPYPIAPVGGVSSMLGLFLASFAF